MTPRILLLLTALTWNASSANLAIATYLRDGFSPAAIASDSEGNIYLAGSAVLDVASGMTGAAVVKVNPDATRYVYVSYLDSAAPDQLSAIAVDSAGNAYIAGSTSNPNFPVVGTRTLGSPPADNKDTRSFVVKLDPQGSVVFSILVGGSASSTARGIAITPDGRILVSGIAASSGFPLTPGAYGVADSAGQWFLMALDPTASRRIFSATGIGGSALALDAAGNIYMAGSSVGTNYPTTPGAYQTTFSQGFTCFGFCRISFPGNLQHVTKTDAAASRLIYSTGINALNGLAGSTTNTGLAVDAAGNAYITGTLFEAQYPFTQAAPTGTSSYLTKLDAAGASLLFSIPVGGGGVQLDSSGAVFVGGTVVSVAPIGFPGLPGPPPPVAIPPAFSGIPQVCLPNFTTSLSDAYVMKIDAATGSVQDQQWIDGSAPGAAGITIASGKAWITGPTPGPDTPISPGALTTQPLGPGFLAGVYLSAVDFASPESGPSIACVSDGGNFSHVGAVASFQLLSIFGANLGPATPAAAADGDAKLGNVSVTFDGVPAQLFYVSASQINVAVPPPVPLPGSVQKSSIAMQLTYKGSGVRRQFPLSASNLNLFADLSSSLNPCPDAALTDVGFHPVAENADGSKNSCTNPAAAGSVVSLFVHGAGGFGAPPAPLVNLHASIGSGCTALVTNTTLMKGIVYKLEVSLPATFESCGERFSGTAGIPLTLSYNDAPVGPFNIPADLAGPALSFSPPGDPMRMIVWVKQ